MQMSDIGTLKQNLIIVKTIPSIFITVQTYVSVGTFYFQRICFYLYLNHTHVHSDTKVFLNKLE